MTLVSEDTSPENCSKLRNYKILRLMDHLHFEMVSLVEEYTVAAMHDTALKVVSSGMAFRPSSSNESRDCLFGVL